MRDERVELLLRIARTTLDIRTFALTGEPETDLHRVRADDIGRALEAAYDAGLIVGRRVALQECVENA